MIITDTSFLQDICDPISSSEEERDIISKLEQELEISNKAGSFGIGLAAPQIGIKKRAAIVRIGPAATINLINSVIVDKNGSAFSQESCLSLPTKSVVVQRSSDILIENNSFGIKQKFAAYGLAAICIQHEMDHWDGILIVDRAIEKHTESVSATPNLPCPCGSGKKARKCCKKVK